MVLPLNNNRSGRSQRSQQRNPEERRVQISTHTTQPHHPSPSAQSTGAPASRHTAPAESEEHRTASAQPQAESLRNQVPIENIDPTQLENDFGIDLDDEGLPVAPPALTRQDATTGHLSNSDNITDNSRENERQ